MMYQWTPEMVRYMGDASAHSDYHARLAALMAPWLTKDMHICDAGCGLGDLAAALTPYAGHVTAVDRNENALAALREKNLPGVTALCGDIAALTPQRPYDAMVFCFFGGIEEILDIAPKQCRGDVFIISRNYTAHRFSVGDHPTGSYGFPRARAVLEERRIPYEARELELEFGQPFRSRDDARRFFELYSRDGDNSLITDAFLDGKLEPCGWEGFPLYMPHRRRLGFIHFKTEEIR